MVKWRSVELERILGGRLDAASLPSGLLERLVADQAPESEVLDFKQELYGKRDAGADRGLPELPTHVAAFANRFGGAIVFGIAAGGGLATQALPLSGNREAIENQMRDELVRFISPAVEVDFVFVDSGAGTFALVLVIPPSASAPHSVSAISNQHNHVAYPVRDGPRKRYMAEREVALRYRERDAGTRVRAEKLADVVAGGSAELARTSSLWVFLAATPEYPVAGRLDAAAVMNAKSWFNESGISSPTQPNFAQADLVYAGPSKSVLTMSDHTRNRAADVGDPLQQYVELHVDGTTFVAIEVGPNASRPSTQDRAFGIDLDETVGNVLWLTECALRWAAHVTGPRGVADCVIGVLDTSHTGAGPHPIALSGHSRFGYVGRIVRRREASALFSVDMGTITDQSGYVAAAHVAASTLLQWFGVPEVEMITADGAILVDEWGPELRAQARNYAAVRQVAAAPEG